MRKKHEEKIISVLDNQINLLSSLIKKTTVMNNNIVDNKNKPLAFHGEQDREKAKELREINPELFDFIIEIMKLYFS